MKLEPGFDELRKKFIARLQEETQITTDLDDPYFIWVLKMGGVLDTFTEGKEIPYDYY